MYNIIDKGPIYTKSNIYVDTDTLKTGYLVPDEAGTGYKHLFFEFGFRDVNNYAITPYKVNVIDYQTKAVRKIDHTRITYQTWTQVWGKDGSLYVAHNLPASLSRYVPSTGVYEDLGLSTIETSITTVKHITNFHPPFNKMILSLQGGEARVSVFDMDTKTFTVSPNLADNIYGTDLNGTKYAMSAACQDGRYVYVILGQEPYYVVSWDLQTGTITKLFQATAGTIVFEDRVDRGIWAVQQSLPNGEGYIYHRLDNNTMTEVGRVSNGYVFNTGSNGTAADRTNEKYSPFIGRVDLPLHKFDIEQNKFWIKMNPTTNQSGAYEPIQLDLYKQNQYLGNSLTVLDNRIYGGSKSYGNFWAFTPYDDSKRNLGSALAKSQYGFNTYGENLIWAGYPSGSVCKYNPQGILNWGVYNPNFVQLAASDPNANPGTIASYLASHNTNYAKFPVVNSEGKIITVNEAIRVDEFYAICTTSLDGTKVMSQKFFTWQMQAMVMDPTGRYAYVAMIPITNSFHPTEIVDTKGQIVKFDTFTNTVVDTWSPVDRVNYDRLLLLNNGNLMLWVRDIGNFTDLFIKVNFESKTVLNTTSTFAYNAHSTFVYDGSQWVYSLCTYIGTAENQFIRVSMNTNTVEVIQAMPGNTLFNGAVRFQNDLYFVDGTNLKVMRSVFGPVQSNPVPTKELAPEIGFPYLQIPNFFEISMGTTTIELDASDTIDVDGTIAAYNWSKKSGNSDATIESPTQGKTRINNLSNGTYVFTVAATDNESKTSTRDVTVNIEDPLKFVDFAEVSLSFPAVSPTPANGYRLRYKIKNSTDNYTVLTSSSPGFDLGIKKGGQVYECVLDSACQNSQYSSPEFFEITT